MLFFGKSGLLPALSLALPLLLLLAGGGCLPEDSSQVDEEKEPHYVLGKNRVNARDFTGAVEAFQEALEANPRSAVAHFQLACLYDSEMPDPAAAIFHYQEYLRLNPQAGNLDVIRQRIYTCKQQLAADIMPLPSAPAAQKQLEALAQKNHDLQAQVDALNGQLRQWNAYYASQQAAAARAAADAASRPAPSPTSPLPEDISVAGTAESPVRPAQRSSTPAVPATPTVPANPPVAHARTHLVQPGETLAGIARKAGVSLAALEAANPGVNPKKLRTGQPLNLPTR